LDAVINYSWNLLSGEHRDALAGLGLFVGGFTREAAAQVALAPLRTLSALVDKALVRRGSAGRYDLHELVRQFALARLRSRRAQEAAAARRYVAFYSDHLVDVYERSRGPGELAANLAFRAELPNLLSCLRRCLAGDRVDALERIGPPLVSLLHTHGLLREALAVAEETTRTLEGRARAEAMAQMRLQWGRAAITGGRPDAAKEQLERACESTRHAAPGVAARSLYFRSAFYYQQGDIAAAQRDADEATRLASGSDDQELWCMCYNQNGSLASMHARFDVAEDYLRKGLAAARAQGTPSLIAMLLCGLAVPLYYQDRLAEAAALTREAADLSERIQKTPNAVFARNNLAVLELSMGNIDAARREAQAALRLARDGAHAYSVSACLATLGEIELAAGCLAEARRACEEALAMATAVGNALQKTHALYVRVRVAIAESDRGSAQRTLLAFRDEHARHRLTVRVPMLIVAAARVALTSADGDAAVRARGWLVAVTATQDVDASMRKEARALLDGAALPPDPPTLADAEAEAGRYVDTLAASVAGCA
jgi:tetratricopeptide (TPR) repeat protein